MDVGIPYRKLVSIGKASKFIGVHPDTLRSWEKKGKIKSIRTAGNHRRYNIDDVAWLGIYHLWKELISNEDLLDKWLKFYKQNDPVLSHVCSYLRSNSESLDELFSLKFAIVAKLHWTMYKETGEWIAKIQTN